MRKKGSMTRLLNTEETVGTLHTMETLQLKAQKDNLQTQLNIQLDKNGTIRRFANAELKQSPKILPKKEYFIKLVSNIIENPTCWSSASDTNIGFPKDVL